MSQLLALSAGILFGIGDFMGGIASRRMPVWWVLAWSQGLGTPVLVVGLLVVEAGGVSTGDIVFGALAGLFGIIGLGILYAALSAGTMSLIAPIAGAVAAVIPVVADLLSGSSLDGREWLGIVVAVAAVLLIGIEGRVTRMDRKSIRQAVAAGVAFGLFFIAFAETSQNAGLWPLVGARSVTIPLTVLGAILFAGATRPSGRSIRLAGVAGVFDVSAMIALALALQRGPLAINAVLSSLFPAFTAIAAVVLLRERPTRGQSVGITLALSAAAMLAL